MKIESTREAYGKALLDLGGKNKNIVVLDADVSVSTKTDKFAKAYPDRFFSVGIAEQNLVGIAAGLALCGKIPFVSAYATFCPGRCFDQIRNTIAVSNLDVKIVSTHAGITIGEDGVSHQAIEDIAMMRSIPNMKIVVPCDSVETKKAVEAISKVKGPVYMRLTRINTPTILNEDYEFEFGKAVLLNEGSDVAIFATGIMVPEGLKAVEALKKDGISTALINIHTIKPLDEKTVIKISKEVKLVITLEDHNIIGGLGSAIAEVLAENSIKTKMKRMGVADQFGQSGEPIQLMKEYGLDSAHIVNVIKNLMVDE